MQGKIYFVVLVIIFTLFAQSLLAQVFIKKSGTGEGDIFFLNELSAITADKEGTIVVEYAMPGDQRPEGYRDLDLKQGDEILMVNAKRVKKVKDLENIYNELEVGETVKLGIRRGEEMFILSYNKIDPEKLPKRRLMIRKAGPGKASSSDDKQASTHQIKIENPDGKVKLLMGTGLVAKETENQVKIDKIIPEMNEALGELDVKAGDVIVILNGNKIKSVGQFSQIYDKINVGDEVQLVTTRKNKKINVKFKKPEANGQVFIKEK